MRKIVKVNNFNKKNKVNEEFSLKQINEKFHCETKRKNKEGDHLHFDNVVLIVENKEKMNPKKCYKKLELSLL